MKKQMIAAVTALAIALTGTAVTPVMADDRGDEALKVLLGAAAIGLLVNEANKNKNKSDKQNVQSRNWNDWNNGRWNQQKGWQRNRLIPSQCVFPIRGSNGRRDVVSQRCLRETGMNRNIPDRCAFDIRTQWGRQTVYGAKCLTDRGFVIADMKRYGRAYRHDRK